MKRLAFFGAFNPPTLAHINLAEHAMNESGLGGVVFVPSKAEYITNNQGKEYAFTDDQRLSMLNKIAASRPWMSVSDIEIMMPKQPRTYETLCALKASGLECSLLVGSDKLKEMDEKWRFVEEIADEFGIVCISRASDDCQALIDSSRRLKPLMQHINIVAPIEKLKSISSTQARRQLMELKRLKDELKQLLPEEIINNVIYDFD